MRVTCPFLFTIETFEKTLTTILTILFLVIDSSCLHAEKGQFYCCKRDGVELFCRATLVDNEPSALAVR